MLSKSVGNISEDGAEQKDENVLISKDHPGVEIETYFKKRELIVRLDESKLPDIPALLLLIPDRGGDIIIAEPRKVEGTNFYSAIFKNTPVDGYKLIFPPQK